MGRVIASARCRRRAAQSERLFCSAEGRAAGGACGTPLQLGVRLRPHGFLLLWALLPRAARRDALRARHRFLSDSRALLRGEEAGWRRGGGGATAAGGRGRSRAANRRLEREELGARPGPAPDESSSRAELAGCGSLERAGQRIQSPGAKWFLKSRAVAGSALHELDGDCLTPVSDSGVGREKENFRTSRRGQAWCFECAWHGSLFIH